MITYANHTGDPIPELVFHLYLNAFRDRDSIFLQEGGTAHRDSDWDPEQPGWIQVSGMQLANGTLLAVEEIEDGTLARAALPAPIAPGAEVQLELDFTAQLPRVFARTGHADDYYMVGQWFPKLGVWQDGAWNAHPFHANSEFYADFGNYDVTITLPAEYVTGATGVPVSSRENADGTRTAVYRAEAVIDFAWTASPRFLEARRLVQDVEVIYLYLPEHRWTIERVLDAAEAAVSRYSRWYGPYPYSRLTVVDVPDDGRAAGGMEYPMLVTAGITSFTGVEGLLGRDADRSLELVTVHEIGHQWWQTTVAFNEAEEPWLDEGFTEYSTVRVMEEVYGADTSAVDSPYLRVGSLDTRRMEYLANPRVPMYGRAWDFGMLQYVVATYSKPTLALRTLERSLGEQRMLEILSTFYQRYRFAHPTTEDFRTVAEQVSGEDLDWFFDGAVYGDSVLNYRLSALEEHSVTVERQGDLCIPTEILVTFTDGSSALEPWDGQHTPATFSYPERAPVLRAEVDPEQKIALDLQWSDNGLSSRLEVSPWLALVTRLIYGLQNALLALGGL
jgi:hypothetical protein